VKTVSDKNTACCKSYCFGFGAHFPVYAKTARKKLRKNALKSLSLYSQGALLLPFGL